MLRHVALVRTDVSEDPHASIIWVTRIGELGALAVTKQRKYCVHLLLLRLMFLVRRFL
jgi:hypothetical protein